jgi:hypothetical protein
MSLIALLLSQGLPRFQYPHLQNLAQLAPNRNAKSQSRFKEGRTTYLGRLYQVSIRLYEYTSPDLLRPQQFV